ncbi:MAG: hypothetical protein V7731_03985 [Amphritea sp.]
MSINFTPNEIITNYKGFVETWLKDFIEKQGIDTSMPESCQEELISRGQWLSHQSTADAKYRSNNQGFQWDGVDQMMFYIDSDQSPIIEFVCLYADGSQIREELMPKEKAA